MTLVTVNGSMSTRGNVQETNQDSLALKQGAGAGRELQQARESAQCGQPGEQERATAPSTSTGQARLVNSSLHQGLEGLRQFHSPTRKEISRLRVAVQWVLRSAGCLRGGDGRSPHPAHAIPVQVTKGLQPSASPSPAWGFT